MDNAGAAPHGDVEGVFGGHIWYHGGRVAARPISIAKEFGGPDGLLCVPNRATNAEAMLKQLIDNMQALEAVGSGH